MSNTNHQEFIDELIFCLNEEDIVKAKALLQFASDSNINVDVQNQALLELGKAPEAIAFPILEFLTRIEMSSAEVQESLYDLILDKAYGNTDLVISYLTKGDKKNQLVYIRAAGDLLLKETATALTSILVKEKDVEIINQTVKTLGSFRLVEYLPLFPKIINTYNYDFKIKQSAIYAIAEFAGKKAVDHLHGIITGNNDIDIIAIEALAGIQDQYALEMLTSFLKSPHTHIRDGAIDQLMKIGGKSVPILTKAASNAESDYMIHLITTLGYLGDQAAVPALLDIINLKPEDPNIRQATYEAMERIPSAKTAISLAIGLQDPVEAVRMCAARAVDKNLSKVLVAGLKNIIREGDENACNTVAALIDSEADSIFNFLIKEDAFKSLAIKHIQSNASSVTRDHFVKLLGTKGEQDLIEQINAITPTKSQTDDTGNTQIFVVDDSKMMLKLYQNKLGKLGYEVTAFEFPQDAISAVNVSKPDLIITDLNMPQINGLQLTKKIRRKYSRQDLPILMITTQSDFVEPKIGDPGSKINDSQINQTGINKILHKPFTDENFRDTLEQMLGTKGSVHLKA